jgi:hypothetical protein
MPSGKSKKIRKDWNNGTHQLLVYIDVNVLGENIYIIKKSTEGRLA